MKINKSARTNFDAQLHLLMEESYRYGQALRRMNIYLGQLKTLIRGGKNTPMSVIIESTPRIHKEMRLYSISWGKPHPLAFETFMISLCHKDNLQSVREGSLTCIPEALEDLPVPAQVKILPYLQEFCKNI